MTLDTSGGLLEGIRLANGNNQYTFPPQSIIQDQTVLNASADSLGRAEYMLFVSGQTAGESGIEIADSNLSFLWCRNNSTVIRFDYDMYARRWNTLPGGRPFAVGVITNTAPLLKAPLPDPIVSRVESPYYIYLGIPRQVTFNVEIVENDAAFSSPPTGTVQISLATGDLNFSTADVSNPSYIGQTVYVSQQAFNARSKSKGIFGTLPISNSADYLIYLNPIPGQNQIPRIRIGYQSYLTPIVYPTEVSLITPPSGFVSWSQDTGRTIFSQVDISNNFGANVYYDGVTLGQISFTRTTIGNISGTSAFFPNSIGNNGTLITTTDPLRYIIFAEFTIPAILSLPAITERYYFLVIFGNSNNGPLSGPGIGQVLVDSATGNVYINKSDAILLNGNNLIFIDSILSMERGVGIQFYRSGVNGGGIEQADDFVENYFVAGQVIQDGLTAAPLVMLPTVPIEDSTLAFSIQQSTAGGTFVGPLVNSSDPTQQALGYATSLDNKQVSFTARKTILKVLQSNTSSIKLDDATIVTSGFEVTRSNIPLVTGVDFSFDSNSGILDFLEPIGEDDPGNILNIPGIAVLPNIFITAIPTFNSSNDGQFLFVDQGLNAGLYQITSVINPYSLLVSPSFNSAISTQADVRVTREIVADRFFNSFTPPLRTFSVSIASSVNGLYTELDQSEFTVIQSAGQVNLTNPTQPGNVYKIKYVWSKSPDNGVTVTPTHVTELAAFKIRQETATFIPNTATINFNPAGLTVQINQGITLYINGVTQDSTSYNFIAPGTITYNTKLVTSDVVIINYYVAEAPGGKTSFNLVNSPITVDYPTIVAGAPSATFNGDQTSILQTGGAFLFNGAGATNTGSGTTSGSANDLVIIGTVTYNPSNPGTDTTTVSFDVSPANYGNGVQAIQFCSPILGINAPSYMVKETNHVDMIANNTSTVSIKGNSAYSGGTVILINNDPYLVTSSTFSSKTNVTTLTLADKTLHDYIMPVLQHTIRPVLSAGTDFTTSKTATLAFPFTLVLTGATPQVLIQNVDYTVGDGGVIKLTNSVGYGDVLNALYVARATQLAGTQFILNYAYSIAPSSNNGMFGQQLVETYNLYSPDTFFYNIETIPSFIPVVIAALQQQTPSGSGPNTQNVSSPQTKDQGSQSLYWPEVHFGNEDIVVQRLLSFYNDLINNYEDILSCIDGRVVGGVNGKFRYDGTVNNVSSYSQITNDIDDTVVLYDTYQATNFYPFTTVAIPVVGAMYESNNLSRIYPNSDAFVTVAINGNTEAIIHFLDVIGSTHIGELTTASTTNPSRAYSPLASVLVNTSTLVATCISAPEFDGVSTVAGDLITLIPTFTDPTQYPPQTVQLYNPDGSLNGTEGVITSITPSPSPSYTGTYTILVDYSTPPSTAPTITTAVSTTSNSMVLPQATINVTSTISNFPTSGMIEIVINGQLTGSITYTGVTNLPSMTPPTFAFTGCSGGTGTLTTGDAVVLISTPTVVLPTNSVKGGIVEDTSTITSHGTYVPDRDFLLADGSGNFLNIALPWPFNAIQNSIQGNELVDMSITFTNTATTPVRIPVLDGSILSDNGRYPLPPISRIGELDYIGFELGALGSLGVATVSGSSLTSVGYVPFPVLPKIGQVVTFLSGPNVNLSSTVSDLISTTDFTVSPAFPNADITGSDFYVAIPIGSLSDVVTGEIQVISTNIDSGISATGSIAPPPKPAFPAPPFIGAVNSELISIDIAIRSYGQQQYAGLVATPISSTVFMDSFANFTTANPPISNGSYLYITSGVNQGLYSIQSATNNTITINPNPPFPVVFPSTGINSPYLVFQPWSFISSAEFAFASSFQQQTLAFLSETQAWLASIESAGAAARLAAVQARQTSLNAFVITIQNLLGQTDNLYNTRYLWIQQRTDMQVGLLIQQVQAMAQRIINTANLIANQQKLLVINNLLTSITL